MVQGTWSKKKQVENKEKSDLKAIDFKKLKEVFSMRFSKDKKHFIVDIEDPNGKKGVIVVSQSSKDDTLYAGTDVEALRYNK